MTLLKIIEIAGNGRYALLSSDYKHVYDLAFEFYDLEEQPEVGDCLLMPPPLLDRYSEGFTQPYSYSADLRSDCGRALPNIDADELAVLIKGNRGVALKRLYG